LKCRLINQIICDLIMVCEFLACQTGKIDESTTYDRSDIRSNNPRFTPEAIRANRVVVELLERIGKEKEPTPAQIALAWLLEQKPWIVPIPGSRKLERLDENNSSVDIELTSNELSEIREAMSQITFRLIP